MSSYSLTTTGLICSLWIAAARSIPTTPISWQNDVNVSMCNWAQPRVNIIRDTIYIDGGLLWWQMGLSNGGYAAPQSDDETSGSMYSLSLSVPFNEQTNLTGLFKTMSKNGGSSSNNVVPNYDDGVMFANDDEFILYGGLSRLTDSQTPPPADVVLGYEAFEWGPPRASWQRGFVQKSLPSGLTRYITNGAGVSSPSENLGFYFSGMHGAQWGAIEDGDESADTISNTLITVNMSTMRVESWQNDTLPTSVPGRANAELAWLPVSESGVLVAIGGVIHPEVLTASRNLTQAEVLASNQTSPTFMETLPIYDVATTTWYMQNTTGDIPPPLTLFCSTVVAAPDNSSFNIYIYGGYDGINAEDAPSDDVYILSIPSFTWIKAYSGQYPHGRSGHKCVKAYPDQMFVLGGIFKGDPSICLDGGVIQVFNLNTLEFQDSYDPRHWSEYQVPAVVTAQIGGNANGSAIKKAPAAWNSNALAGIFSMKYNKPLTTYYPYALQNDMSSGSSTSQPQRQSSKGGVATWTIAVIGVVSGLVLAGIVVTVWWLARKRYQKQPRKPSTAGTLISKDETSVDSSSSVGGSRTISMVSPVTATSTVISSEPTEKDADESAVSPSTLISPVSPIYQPRQPPICELESPTRKYVELPTDFNFREKPGASSHCESSNDDRSVSPYSPYEPDDIPESPARSIQTTPPGFCRESSRRISSIGILGRLQGDHPPPVYSRQNSIDSVAISDMTESERRRRSSTRTVVPYYDPRQRHTGYEMNRSTQHAVFFNRDRQQ